MMKTAHYEQNKPRGLYQSIRSMCGVNGIVNVVKTLAQIAGDFSGRTEGSPYVDSLDSDWTKAWVVLDDTAKKLEEIFKEN